MDSREKIRLAARELFSTRKFSAITVDDITQAAGVSRATFYRHFQDKYDLLIHTVYLDDTHPDMVYDYKCTLREHLEFCIRISRRMQANREYIAKVFRVEGPNSFMSLSRRWMVDLYTRRVVMNSPRREPSVEEALMISLFCNGAVEAARQWIDADCEPDAEIFGLIICQSLPAPLYKYFPESPSCMSYMC